MFSHRFARALRAASPLALAASVLLSTLGAPTPAAAQDPLVIDHRNGGDPAARIQIVLKHVKILDANEGRFDNDGEFRLEMGLTCMRGTPAPCPTYTGGAFESKIWEFNAESGDTHPLGVVLPDSPPSNPNYDATPETGYPLRPGRVYELRFFMQEKDFAAWDDMGHRAIVLREENGWGLGPHVLRSIQPDGKDFGDFEVEIEIRRMPFPDLRAAGITVQNLPGSPKKRVCMRVQELNALDVGPFEVALSVDHKIPDDARVTSPGQRAGQDGNYCVETVLPTIGGHQLEMIVDGGKGSVLEYDEANNTFQMAYNPAAQATSPSATPMPSPTANTPSTARDASQAGLVVSAIKVNGEEPDGKNDCKDGKNTVGVVVKNAGAANADNLVVRLAVDGAQGNASEQSVKSLGAGQEQEVRFENVSLKKGERKLTATANSKNADGEADEGNNALTVTARCGGN